MAAAAPATQSRGSRIVMSQASERLLNDLERLQASHQLIGVVVGLESVVRPSNSCNANMTLILAPSQGTTRQLDTIDPAQTIHISGDG